MTQFYVFATLLISSLSFHGTVCNVIKLNVDHRVFKATGESLAVTCYGADSKGLHWKKGSHEIKPSDESMGKERATVQVIEGKLFLLLTSITSGDVGTYSCHDKVSRKAAKFELSVRAPIQFMGTNDTVIGYEGQQDLVVPCDAVGPREPTIRWHLQSATRSLNDTDKFKEAGDGLYIHNVTADDAGVYTCRAMIEELADMKSKNIHVFINHKPKPTWDVSAPTPIVYIDDRTTVNLSCVASAYPNPTVLWYVDGMEMHNWPTSFYTEAVTPGNHRCVVSNEYGNITRDFIVKEGKRPGPPTKVVAHNATKNSIILTSKTPKIEEEHRITSYVLEVRERQGRFNKTLEFRSGPPFSISGLKEDTAYLIKLRAINHMGHGEYSPEIEASTSIATPVFAQLGPLLPVMSLTTLLYCSL